LKVRTSCVHVAHILKKYNIV